MKKFVKNNKIEIIIFLIISLTIPYFGYINEDKNSYYSAKIKTILDSVIDSDGIHRLQ